MDGWKRIADVLVRIYRFRCREIGRLLDHLLNAGQLPAAGYVLAQVERARQWGCVRGPYIVRLDDVPFSNVAPKRVVRVEEITKKGLALVTEWNLNLSAAQNWTAEQRSR